MDIKYRLYPHPVLWKETDDYKTSSFDCDISISRDIKRFVLTLGYSLNNKELEEMVQNGEAEYVLHIECPLSSYRFISKSVQREKTIILPDEHLLGRISLCPFIVAKKDLNNFSNGDWNEDYAGESFDVSKGTILAIGSQQIFSVEKDNEDLSNVPSIFTVYKKETTEEIPMEVELNDHKIRIGLNISDYENYYAHSHNKPDIVNSFLIFPTLVYAFERLKEGIEEYSEYRWFKALDKMFTLYSMKLNDDILSSKSSIELAQKIMILPVNKAFHSLNAIDNNIAEEDT